jgi:hypothetical protein
VSDPSILAQQANDPTFDDVWEEITWRGLVQVSTDEAALRTLLTGAPITYYCGFDPTAASLHLGNLVQLLLMRRLQLAGHRPLGPHAACPDGVTSSPGCDGARHGDCQTLFTSAACEPWARRRKP